MEVPADVDTYLAHDRNGLRPYQAWFCAGAFNIEFRAGIMSQKSFSHLASG